MEVMTLRDYVHCYDLRIAVVLHIHLYNVLHRKGQVNRLPPCFPQFSPDFVAMSSGLLDMAWGLAKESAAQEGICNFLLILNYLKRCNACKCTEIHENEIHYRSVRVIHGVPQCALDNMIFFLKRRVTEMITVWFISIS